MSCLQFYVWILILGLRWVKVALPLALTGGKASDDPEVQALHDELNEINRKLQSHVVLLSTIRVSAPTRILTCTDILLTIASGRRGLKHDDLTIGSEQDILNLLKA